MSAVSLATQARTPVAVGPVLAVEDLVVSYESRRRRTPVVHGVSFHVGAGEVVALVGESGSGQTTTAQAVIGLLAETGRIAGGSDETLLNTIAERILGLPQDHRPDKGIPFNQIPA